MRPNHDRISRTSTLQSFGPGCRHEHRDNHIQTAYFVGDPSLKPAVVPLTFFNDRTIIIISKFCRTTYVPSLLKIRKVERRKLRTQIHSAFAFQNLNRLPILVSRSRLRLRCSQALSCADANSSALVSSFMIHQHHKIALLESPLCCPFSNLSRDELSKAHLAH
ncbi:hypothetical protein HYPSUDRAFT_675812 [Hypholoma sublateritium FD-334 SS-4]|uniref:Uncharacterized protein n=1 Tax=Hypholoma sublateritium (strain FD-334 SS-4) TaxID=945553 RepID=A0A0D2NSR8_HYPSF|nr:hypothetical protein HYPSUDRAFT_675812 [Hypholoma sublateritium FD-334 SS-4]